VEELSRDDLAAVESAADAYAAAMNGGDWALVAQSFAEDAVRILPHGDRTGSAFVSKEET
jgi:ketosteroid isomerase-like protein